MKRNILYVFPIIIILGLITIMSHLISRDVFNLNNLNNLNNRSVYEIMGYHLFYTLKYHFVIGCIVFLGLVILDILFIIIKFKIYTFIYKFINFSIVVSIIELSLISYLYYLIGEQITVSRYEYIFILFTIIIFTYCISLITLFILDIRINNNHKI